MKVSLGYLTLVLHTCKKNSPDGLLMNFIVLFLSSSLFLPMWRLLDTVRAYDVSRP